MVAILIDIPKMDDNATSHLRSCEEETEQVELRNFASDHAVVGCNPGQDSRVDKSFVKHVALHRLSRRSITLGDVFSHRRGSCISMVSSITMSNFEDSFFTDHGSQEWDLHDTLETTAEEDEEQIMGCSDQSVLASLDQKPICPSRRDSSSTGESSVSLKPHDDVVEHRRREADYIEHPYHTQRTRRELPPVKPGRKGSGACPLDFIPVRPGRHESVSTFHALDLPESEQLADQETTTSTTTTTPSPCFVRSERMRLLLVDPR